MQRKIAKFQCQVHEISTNLLQEVPHDVRMTITLNQQGDFSVSACNVRLEHPLDGDVATFQHAAIHHCTLSTKSKNVIADLNDLLRCLQATADSAVQRTVQVGGFQIQLLFVIHVLLSLSTAHLERQNEDDHDGRSDPMAQQLHDPLVSRLLLRMYEKLLIMVSVVIVRMDMRMVGMKVMVRHIGMRMHLIVILLVWTVVRMTLKRNVHVSSLIMRSIGPLCVRLVVHERILQSRIHQCQRVVQVRCRL
mmetsp:Transcript_20721/g.59013  ORF Transcript_20721/g.59013 Transcript_20721/m.59013 type:complete len:249 (+) Transcript_20721:2593-3339(+)